MDLRIDGLRAGYRTAPDVLRDLTLHAAKGERVAVLGPSGSGKTTLVRVLAGLHPARSGRVVVGGEDVTALPPERRRIGLVPQDGALFGQLTVAGNVGYGLRGLTGRRALGDRRVLGLLELVGLTGLGGRLPHELSGGQQQRVALARALAIEPRMVLLDEPFNALDATLRTRVRAEVYELLRESGVTTMLITHDQDEALAMSDRLAVVRDGVVVQCGSPSEVYHRPVDSWVAAFVGDAVLVPGVRTAGGVDTVLGRIGLQSTGSAGPDGPTLVMLRPEQLRLDDPAGTYAAGEVRSVDYRGHSALVAVAVPNPDGTRTSVVVRCAGVSPPAIGARVGVRVVAPGHELSQAQDASVELESAITAAGRVSLRS